MDTSPIAILLVAVLAALMVIGTARDILRGRADGENERDELRLDKLRLQIQLETANREIAALQKEVSYWKYEIHGTTAAIDIHGATVSVGRDLAGGNVAKRDDLAAK